jgi:hypothetical protein
MRESREERERRTGRRSTPAPPRDRLESTCRHLSAALGSSETICKLPHVRAVRRVCLCGADDPHQLVNRVDLLRWLALLGSVALTRLERKCAKLPIDFAGIFHLDWPIFSPMQQSQFGRRISPSALTIHEQKQWGPTSPRSAGSQYRIRTAGAEEECRLGPKLDIKLHCCTRRSWC